MTAPLPDPEDEALKKDLVALGQRNAEEAAAILERMRQRKELVDAAAHYAKLAGEFALEVGLELGKAAALSLVSEQLEKHGR